MWSDIEWLSKLARVIPYIFIVLGFLVAMFGQYAKTVMTDRIETLQQQAELQKKQTVPHFDVELFLNQASEFSITITALNNVPVYARWSVMTKGNQLVSGFMLESETLHPTTQSPKWEQPLTLQLDKVKDDYLELSFEYTSIYSAELGNPVNLSSKITQAYSIANGNLRRMP